MVSNNLCSPVAIRAICGNLGNLWFSLRLRVLVAISQLCKTNPISPTTKTPQPPWPQRITKTNCPAPLEKTNPIEPKRTQFQNGQYEHKYSKKKGLCQRTTNNDQRTLSKTNPIKPKTLTAGTKSCPERPVVSKVEPSRRDAIRTLHNRRRAAII